MKNVRKGKVPSEYDLKTLADLCDVPPDQRPGFATWVITTLKSREFAANVYRDNRITRKQKIQDVVKMKNAANALAEMPDWLPGAMIGWEQLALTDAPLRARRLERGFQAAEQRIRREEVGISRLRRRLQAILANLDQSQLTTDEVVARKSALKPEDTWLANCVLRIWLKFHPQADFTSVSADVTAFAVKLWQLADDLNEDQPRKNTVRARLRSAIAASQKRNHVRTPPATEPAHPINSRQWRAAFADRLISHGMDDDSAIELAAECRFVLADDPVAAADRHWAVINAEIPS